MEPLRDNDPRQVGAYRLDGRLGGGGMGQVFLGRSRSGRRVAVKLVRPELADDAGFRRRFAVEVDAARRVGGFYTAQVVDADPAAAPPWLVTAYIPGPSLQQVVDTHGPLPVEAIAVLGAALAEGLAAIHSCDLVHRDLKPSNVILAEDGPRVIDFGIARALDATSHTLSRTVLGTPSFMSPEQARGQEIGPASDVFALGLVLAFAATGRSPFGTGPAEALIYRVVHDEPDLTGLPAHLADLVGRCLAKDPTQRPGVADVLDEFTNSVRTTTPWLPPPVATMVAERGADGGPVAPPPRDGRTQLLDTRPAPDPRWAPGRPVASTQGGGTAIAAMVLVLLCIPGMLDFLFSAAGLLEEPSAPVALLWVNVVAIVVEATLVVTGALLLWQRNPAGRRVIAVTGTVVALHSLSGTLQSALTGAQLTPDIHYWWTVYVIGPLTAAVAVAAVITARHPATAGWCLPRSQHAVSAGPGIGRA